jgi:putative acetyltransferase
VSKLPTKIGVSFIKIKFRAAIIEDIDELLTLLIETVKSTCKNDYNQNQINAWVSSAKKKEHWDKFINDQFSLIAEVNNKAVGFGSLENGDYIFFMYVHKEYLGLGIASSIYNELKKESQRLGHTQMTANVSKTARHFFESKGFEVTKENKNIINNVVIINYHMSNNYSS